MNKITEQHLNRIAYVYIRQSTLQQVQQNLESQRIQYGLVNRAKELGWQEVKVIDDDLGISGTGKVCRPGFEKLLSEICSGNVGAVFAMDASRLARNGREWHTLLELCALVKTILVDLETIYDPGQINDRLLLGMRGTISEMEVSLFRQRSEYAIKQKAQRGEMYTIVPIGYLITDDNCLEKDSDKRIQEAIFLVFKKFRHFVSARQTLLWFRQEKIELPCVNYETGKRIVQWKLPVYTTILKILTNPIFAGSYAYGKTKTEVKIINGIKKLVKGKRLEREKWSILIHDHHEGYISWNEYETNQRLIKDNANMRGAMVRGSIKRGFALLTGLLRCGHCGRKMLVHYSKCTARYQCRGAMLNHGTLSCISFGGFRIDEAISNIILEVVSPLGINAAVQAIEELEKKDNEIRYQRELALQEARFEAERRRRQYDVIEPENRLVASELEKRWNQSLEKVKELEQYLLELSGNASTQLSKQDKDCLLTLGDDIKKLWFSELATIDVKKRIIRILLKEIIAKIKNDKICLIVHWNGGDHTEIEILKNKNGRHRWVTDVETIHLIETLARYMSDDKIASLLTRLGKRTIKGHAWNKARVCVFRNDHNIPIYQINEHHMRNELLVSEVSQRLNMSSQFIIRLIKKNILPAKQVCKGAPWILEEKDVNNFLKQRKIFGNQLPLSSSSNQISFDFSTT
jgi:DNA invertase Pin-like site-specific DNA recombinase